MEKNHGFIFYMKKRLLLILIYFVFLIAVFEGSARLVFFLPQVSQKIQVRDDLYWRRMWIKRHQSTGKEIYYTFDIYDSSKGWISKPNLRDITVFENKVLNTNSKGFRGRKEYSYRKDLDKVRILLLGDSFTFGDEVSDDETYSYHLQELVPHAEFINMGVHGYGHDQMLILLKEKGIQYNPDIIMLGFLPMDMSRNLLNFRDYAKPKFVLENNSLRLTGTPVPRPEEIMKWNWARPRIVDIASMISFKFKQVSGLYTREKEEMTTAILTEIAKVAENVEAIPVFAYLPSKYEISADSLLKTDLTPGEKILFGMCRTNDKLSCFSTRPVFKEKIAQGVTFNTGGHWRPAGHLAAAEAIKRHLEDKRYLALRDNLERPAPQAPTMHDD
jgi:hypothetical protein